MDWVKGSEKEFIVMGAIAIVVCLIIVGWCIKQIVDISKNK